jgi:hypothetical protein
VLITGPGAGLALAPGLGLGLGFCAKARSGDNPTAVVTVALINPRRVASVVARVIFLADVIADDQLPFAGPDAEPPFLAASLSDGF